MDLGPLLKDFPDIRESVPQDEKLLFKIFEHHPMKAGGLNLIYDRRPHFNDLLRHQADKFKTLVLENSGEIGSFFSWSWGPRYVKGELKSVAYIGDFRVSNHRVSARIWRKFYGLFLHYLTTLKSEGVDYFVTGILDSNQEAQQSLVKNGPRNGFYYHFLGSQLMVNLISRKPWLRTLSRFEIKPLEISEWPEVEKILDEDQKNKLFGYPCRGPFSELKRRETEWDHWRKEDFLVVRERGTIRAVALPWSPREAKRMLVGKMSLSLDWVLRVAHWVGFTVPRPNKNIETLYLTHLGFQSDLKDEIKIPAVQALAKYIFDQRSKYNFHMLSIADETGELSKILSHQYFLQTTRVNLYEVSARAERSFPEGLSIGFEMALV